MTDHEHPARPPAPAGHAAPRLARRHPRPRPLLGRRLLARRAPVHRGRRTRPAAPASAAHPGPGVARPQRTRAIRPARPDPAGHHRAPHRRDQRRPAQPRLAARRLRRAEAGGRAGTWRGADRRLAAQPADLRPRPVLQAAPGHREAPRHGRHAGAGLAVAAHRRHAAGATGAAGSCPVVTAPAGAGPPLVRVLCRLSSRGAAGAGGLACRADVRPRAAGAGGAAGRPCEAADGAGTRAAAAVRAGRRHAGHGALGAAAGP